MCIDAHAIPFMFSRLRVQQTCPLIRTTGIVAGHVLVTIVLPVLDSPGRSEMADRKLCSLRRWRRSCSALLPARRTFRKAAYPPASVRLITGSTGSTADITARFIAAKLGERWGHQVVVDNRAGVGGIIGGEIVANAAPDGYTLYVSGISTQVSARSCSRRYPSSRSGSSRRSRCSPIPAWYWWSCQRVPASNIKEFLAYVKTGPTASTIRRRRSARAAI